MYPGRPLGVPLDGAHSFGHAETPRGSQTGYPTPHRYWHARYTRGCSCLLVPGSRHNHEGFFTSDPRVDESLRLTHALYTDLTQTLSCLNPNPV